MNKVSFRDKSTVRTISTNKVTPDKLIASSRKLSDDYDHKYKLLPK